MVVEWISIGISCLALLFALITLWKNYLAPFKLKISYDSPTFALYKVTPEISGGVKAWWIPSFDTGFTFHNLGKKTGEVTDLRILAKLKSKESIKKYTFYAKWIVDYAKFQDIHTDRFKWIKKSIVREWYPMILTGNEQKSVHIIFEGGRWDNKLTGKLDLCLEIFSSQNNKWVECDRYVQHLYKDMYEEKCTYILSDKKLDNIRKIEDNWSDSYQFILD